jgi:Family of unknown function (DUF6345)
MKSGKLKQLFSVAAAVLATSLAAPGVGAAPPHARMEVGTRCQQEYQNGWQTDVGNNDVWRRCSNFNRQISRTDNVKFYFNLHGAKEPLETTSDNCGQGCGGADSVDFLYMNTHGGANNSTAFFAMWDQNSWALTSNMRLGDNSRQLMVLATFLCSTLQLSDGLTNIITRWLPAFSGGLVMTVGGHGTLYAGNDQSATEFASRMQDGEPIGLAWLESAWYADNRNTPTYMNVGRDANDCNNRGQVTLPSLFGTPILRDGAIGFICWASWN